jgi:hypothetical protein
MEWIMMVNMIQKKVENHLSKKIGTVKLVWIFTIEKLKTDDKSLITCVWA